MKPENWFADEATNQLSPEEMLRRCYEQVTGLPGHYVVSEESWYEILYAKFVTLWECILPQPW